MKRILLCAALLLAAGGVWADDTPQAGPAAAEGEAQAKEPEAGPAGDDTKARERKEGDGKSNLGMSILGNQEAPKSLVIVPWKSSELGATLGISPMLDDSRQPVDREVFMRALSYYEIRSKTAP